MATKIGGGDGGHLVDHPSGTSGKGWTGSGDAGTTDEHLTVEKQLRFQSDRVTLTETWNGPYDKLFKKAVEMPIGKEDVAEELGNTSHGRLHTSGRPFVSGNSMTRAAGNIWTLTLEYTQLYAVSQWSVTFNAIEKDIHTWMSDATSDRDKPDIALVRAWEALEPQSDGYRTFTVDGVKLKGNTLDLAEMINRGITSYTLYQPVVTCTYVTRVFTTVGRNLNCVYADAGSVMSAVNDTSAFVEPANMAQGQPTSAGNLYSMFPTEVNTPKSNTKTIIWVNTSDRLQHNADGTGTRSVEFTGVTEADMDLYYTHG